MLNGRQKASISNISDYSIYSGATFLLLTMIILFFWRRLSFACQDVVGMFQPTVISATSYLYLIGLSMPIHIMNFRIKISSWVQTSFTHWLLKNHMLKRPWLQGTLPSEIYGLIVSFYTICIIKFFNVPILLAATHSVVKL